MARQEHLDLFKQGVETWNAWRKEHSDIRPDLSDANLSKADMSGADLRKADLRGANLSRAILNDTYLIQADLNEAILRSADLSGAILRKAILSNTDFDKASLREAYLDRAELTRANITGADLRRADLTNAILRGADFSKADLSRAELGEADLREAILVGADLSFADLNHAALNEADLSKAILRGAIFRGAVLRGADLSFSDLREANLASADLGGVILRGTDLSDAILRDALLHEAVIGQTIFGDIDLSSVKELDTVIHWSPSTIGTNTLERSKGCISEAFLRGAGLSETFIEFARVLAGKADSYYTCVISYANQDEPFARRLHTDLRQHGVRVWTAPENLKIGETVWHRLDDSSRLYDKLLVVLSQHSVESPWMRQEVMAALVKERQQQTAALFPILLDQAVEQSPSPWSREVCNRQCSDFSQWQNPDRYEQALISLLNDLRASAMPRSA